MCNILETFAANRVQKEIDSVIGTKPFITYEDIGKLKYMDLVSQISFLSHKE